MGCACKFLPIKKGRKATSPAHGPRRALRRPRAGPSGPTHLAPRGADLPVAAEAQLAGLGAVGPGQVPAALQRHGGATRPELLPAAQLAVLGARATGAAAGRPVAGLPAVGTRRAGKRQTETWVAKPEVRGAAMCREGHGGVGGGPPEDRGLSGIGVRVVGRPLPANISLSDRTLSLCSRGSASTWDPLGSEDVRAQSDCCAPRTLAVPGGRTHDGGHGGPWQGSGEPGGLVPTPQPRSSSSSPDSREMQRKMGRQTPDGGERGAGGVRGPSAEPRCGPATQGGIRGARGAGRRWTLTLSAGRRALGVSRSFPESRRSPQGCPGVGRGGHLGDPHLTLEGAGGPGRAGRGRRCGLHPQNLCAGQAEWQIDAPHCGNAPPAPSLAPRSGDQGLTRLQLRVTPLWGGGFKVWRRRVDDVLIKNPWVFLLKDHLGRHRGCGVVVGHSPPVPRGKPPTRQARCSGPGSRRRPQAASWGPRPTGSPRRPPLEEAGCTGRRSRRPRRTLEDPRPSSR